MPRVGVNFYGVYIILPCVIARSVVPSVDLP